MKIKKYLELMWSSNPEGLSQREVKMLDEAYKIIGIAEKYLDLFQNPQYSTN